MSVECFVVGLEMSGCVEVMAVRVIVWGQGEVGRSGRRRGGMQCQAVHVLDIT